MKKRSLLSIDYWLIVPVVALVTVGLVTLLSLNTSLFLNQLFTLSLGILSFLIVSRVRAETFQYLYKPIYFISIFLLFIVFFIGYESHGAIRWVSILGFPIQFSEVLKPFLSLAFAAYLVKKNNTSFRAFVTVLFLLVPIFLLIALQPDLGNALIYAAVTFITLLTYGFPFRFFGFLFLPFLAVSPIIWELLHDYQRNRLLTFINPTSDPLGTSYNVIQAIIAVGSGNFLGKGLSQGTQSGLRFLPERHTDFIFATLSEGLGFVGSFIVLSCFVLLCLKIFQIFSQMENPFAKVFAVATFGFILVHFFVNIGMNVGLLPIVGVTLPFVSYGGNSLLSNLVMLGILSSLSSAYSKRRVLEIK
ncbi:MAG: rod shape-determining protein RodA [Candidatus Levybacteria bacterium]|nr:rod shape-determining protein RodA [Candidatus Levybacteria bacterium]